MLRWFLSRLIDKAEQQTRENADWMRDMLGYSRAAFVKFALFVPLARHRSAAPADALHIARIAAAKAEDCGPCLQTTINYALAGGVSPTLVKAAADGDIEALGPDLGAVYRFADAVANRDPACEDERPTLCELYGAAAIVDFSLAIATTRVFPTVKRGMGYALSCNKVVIRTDRPDEARRAA